MPQDTAPTEPNPSTAIAQTRNWLEKSVIGLNLCPFAKPVHASRRILFVESLATNEAELLSDLQRELLALNEADPVKVETTLLVAPGVLADFLDYNDFLDLADELLEVLELDGIIQVASFHPQYQFGGTEVDDVTNFTNRSPYPSLHLLRESSVEIAVDTHPNIDEIPERNMATLRQLGVDGWHALVD